MIHTAPPSPKLGPKAFFEKVLALWPNSSVAQDLRLARRIEVPISTKDPQAKVIALLARQISALQHNDDWEGLHHLLMQWEIEGRYLSDRRRVARVAVSLILTPLHDALDSHAPPSRIEALLAAFEARAAAGPLDGMAATLAAFALIEVAERFESPAHLLRANRLLRPFEAAASASPLMAEAQFLISHLSNDPRQTLEMAHADWADLDAGDIAVWQALGLALASRPEYSSTDIIEAATRAIWHSERVLGQAAYALVVLPALSVHPTAWSHLDPTVMIQALKDIATRHQRDPLEVNHLAVRLDQLCQSAPPDYLPLARSWLRLLLQQGLTMLIPPVWGLSPTEIRRRIAALFTEELAQGAILRATGTGLALILP